ncbi:MAG: T9SS type A sorting domain-containing protein [Ignavibacteriae bacterium]|nr:T9SS type A sorting domain-containing protein [Ignavibacteriota bacterium]
MKQWSFIILLHCSIYICALAQWEWRYYSPTGNNLHDVEYLSSGILVAVGERGIILRSSDDGISWAIIDSGYSETLRALYFADNFTGYAVGDKGRLLKTTDGGNTWSREIIDSTRDFLDVAFIGKNAWITSRQSLLRSTDGGLSWQLQTFSSGYFSIKLKFFDQNRGWLYGERILLKTTDGGMTWISPKEPPSESFYFTSLAFSDSKTRWLGAYLAGPNEYDGYLFKSTDEGQHWHLDTTLKWDFGISDIIFYDSLYGWFVPARGVIHATSNGGNTWTRQKTAYGSAISLRDSLSLVIVGESGQIFKTSNRGAIWNDINPGVPNTFLNVFFTNRIGYFSGENVYEFVWKTSDGAKNLIALNLTSDTDFYRVYGLYFLDSLRGWASGGYLGGWGAIFHTTDGGMNWINQTGVIPYETFDLWFVDSLNGFGAGSGGSIRRTTNAGNTWTERLYSIASFTSIEFFNRLIGWVAGTSIYKTTNGGNSWFLQTVDGISSFSIQGLHIVDSQTVWAVGQNGEIFHTTNGGDHWFVETIIASGLGRVYLSDVWFVTPQLGWIAGSGVFKTTDGGISWHQESLPADRYIKKLFFTDEREGWAVGYNTVFYLPKSGITYAEHSVSSLPWEHSLFQNYPNPFNPSTVIRYQLPVQSKVTLRIYNVLGQEVKMLVDEVQEAGYKSVEWNSTNNFSNQVASGVYFYRIDAVSIAEQARSFTQVRKMVILR